MQNQNLSIPKSFKPIDSVYLRFERSTGIPGCDLDYAIWGDYNTEEFARRRNFKWLLYLRRGVLVVITSSLAPLLQPGSENVFIELEELNRPGTV
ncbi:hypothetical protein ANSO36C_02900 [Nostoc cf. commune SO-36]|uniref:Uncharacterized protein n=1 Tax=Nostoc cf. commune SO-36 TaxID=449208 RepID=A0ABM7YV41_NOSCO|nr:hypothetical protein [Nostoc commune]BDI14488.1 hypothetical protein ANSO36C_02900 [Nostoc cf. commune SO-36]